MFGIYNNFAYIYDKLMYDVDYKKWADYIEKVFRTNNLKPSLVLDLGCGTGSFCIEMAKRGYDMIGIDISSDMLCRAGEKTSEEGMEVLYLNQDITEFELYGTVDAVVCLLDTINYITEKEDVLKLFKLVKNYLNPGGMFIFDINSPDKLENVLGNNVFYEIGDDITYIWQNEYDETAKVCAFDLTFFIKDTDGKYERYDEVHSEKAFSVDEIKELIKESNMQVEGVYNDLTFIKPTGKSQRIFFICSK